MNSMEAMPQSTQPGLGAAISSSHPQPAVTEKINALNQSEKPWGLIFSMLAALLVLIGIFTLYFLSVTATAQTRRADDAIGDINRQLQEEPLATTERQIQQIGKSLQAYTQTQSQKMNVPEALAAITQTVPQSVRLESVSFDEKGGIKVIGVTDSFLNVGKAYLAATGSSALEAVDLESINFTEKEDGRKVVYSLTAKIKLQRKSTAASTPSSQETTP